MAPLGPAPEMVSKLRPWKWSFSRRRDSSLSAASISVSRPAGASRSSQAREADQGGAVAPVGGARPVQFDRVLARLGQQARIGAVDDAGAGPARPLDGPERRGVGVQADGLAGATQPVEGRPEGVGRGRADLVAQVFGEGRRQLARIDEQIDAAVGADDGE